MDKATGYTESRELMKAEWLYCKRLVKIHGRCWRGERKFNGWMMSLEKLVKKLTGKMFMCSKKFQTRIVNNEVFSFR